MINQLFSLCSQGLRFSFHPRYDLDCDPVQLTVIATCRTHPPTPATPWSTSTARRPPRCPTTRATSSTRSNTLWPTSDRQVPRTRTRKRRFWTWHPSPGPNLNHLKLYLCRIDYRTRKGRRL